MIDNNNLIEAENTIGEALYESVAHGLLSEEEADEINDQLQECFEELNDARGIER